MAAENSQIKQEQQRIDKLDQKVDQKVGLNDKDYGQVLLKKVDATAEKIASNFGIKEQAVLDSPKFKEAKDRAFSDTFKILQGIDEKNIDELTAKLDKKLTDILKEAAVFSAEEAKITKFKKDLSDFNVYMEKRRELEKKGKFNEAKSLTSEYQTTHTAATEQASPLETANFQAEKKYQEIKNTLGDAEKINELLRISQGYIDQANAERKFEQQEGFRVGYILQGPNVSGNGDALSLPGELIKIMDQGEKSPITNLASIVEINPEKGMRLVMMAEASEGTKNLLKELGVTDGWIKAADLRKAFVSYKMKFSHCEEGMTHCVTPKLEGKSLATIDKAQALVEEANVIKTKMELTAVMEKTSIFSKRAINALSRDLICQDGKVFFDPKFLLEFENRPLDQKKSAIKIAQDSLLNASIIEATERTQDPVIKNFYQGQEALNSGDLPGARFKFTKFLAEISTQKDRPELKDLIKFAAEKVQEFNIASIKRLQKINDQLSDPKRYEALLKDPADRRFLKKFVEKNKENLAFQLEQIEAGTVDTRSQRSSLTRQKEQTISITPINPALYGGLPSRQEADNSDQLLDAWNGLVYAEFSTGVESDISKIQEDYLSAARTLRTLGQTDLAADYFEAAMKEDIDRVKGTISTAQKEQIRAKIIAENESKRTNYETTIRQKIWQETEEFNAQHSAEQQKPLEISATDLKALVDEAMAEGVEAQIKKVVMHGMEADNDKGILEKGSKKAWSEYESMMDVNEKWYIISDAGAEKIAQQVFINAVIMALSGGVGSLAAASVRAYMIANGIRSGLALGAAGFVAESTGFELASRSLHAAVLGEKGLFMPAELAKGIGQSMMMFGAIGTGNKLWGAASEAAGLATKEALATAGTVEKLLRKGADWTGQLATESAIFTATSDNSFIESTGDILLLRVGGKLVSAITGKMHEASKKIIEAGIKKAEEAEAAKPEETKPDITNTSNPRETARQIEKQKILKYWQELDAQHDDIDPAKTKNPEAHKAQVEMVSFLREEINLGMPPDIEAMWQHIQKTPLTLEQRKMALATVQNMLRIKHDTGTVLASIVAEAFQKLGVEPGKRFQGDPAIVDDTRNQLLSNKITTKMNLAPFKGKIQYVEISGVLIVRCENNEDFAQIVSTHPEHVPSGVALTAQETSLGIGIIFIRSDQQLNENNGVVRHELQHIFKQGSNKLEEGRQVYNEYGAKFQNGRDYFDELGNLQKEKVLEYFDAEKGDIQTLFKDEVLAFLRTSHHQGLDTMIQKLYSEENGSYDYWNRSKDTILSHIAGSHPELLQKPKFVKEINKLIDQQRSEYRAQSKKLLDSIKKAVDTLVASGMDEMAARDHLADLLMFVQIKDWGKKLQEIHGEELPSNPPETPQPSRFERAKDSVKDWISIQSSMRELKKSEPEIYAILNRSGIKEAHQNNLTKFKGFVEVARLGGWEAKNLYSARIFYNYDYPDLFQDFVSISGVSQPLFDGLLKAMITHKNTAAFKDMVELLKSGNTGHLNAVTINLLFEAKVAFKDAPQLYEAFVKSVISNDEMKTVSLFDLKELYGNDIEKFKIIEQELAGMTAYNFQLVQSSVNICGNNLEVFKSLVAIVKMGKFSFLTPITEIKAIYGDDVATLGRFLEVIAANKVGGLCITMLRNCYDIYGSNEDMFSGFVEAAKKGSNNLSALVSAKDVYGHNLEIFKEFVKIAVGDEGYDLVKILVAAKDIYGQDFAKFTSFKDYLLKALTTESLGFGDTGKSLEFMAKAIVEARPAYGNSFEKFKGFIEASLEESKAAGFNTDKPTLIRARNIEAVQALAAAHAIYGEDMVVFEKVKAETIDLNEKFGKAATGLLTDLASLYGKDFEMFLKVKAEIIDLFSCQSYLKEPSIGSALRYVITATKSLYGNNFESFLKIKKIVIDMEKNRNGGASPVDTLHRSVTGISGEFTIFTNMEIFKAVAEIAKTQGDKAQYYISSLVEARHFYGNDFEKFKKFSDLLIDADPKYSGAIAQAAVSFGKMEMIQAVAENLKAQGIITEHSIRQLKNAENIYDTNMEIFREYLKVISGRTQAKDQIIALSVALEIQAGVTGEPISPTYNHAIFDLIENSLVFSTVESLSAKGRKDFVEGYILLHKKYKGKQTEEEIMKDYVKADLFKSKLQTTTIYPNVVKIFPSFDLANGVTKDNWQFVLFAYSNIDDEDHGDEKVRENLKSLMESSKNFILENLNGLRDRVLTGGKDGLAPYEQAMIDAVVENGVANYKIIERTAEFIGHFTRASVSVEVAESDSEKSIREKSQSLLGKFAQRDKSNQDKNINYSHTDLASFYEKFKVLAGDKESENIPFVDNGLIVKGDHKLLLSALTTFDKLQPDKENYALMQSKVMQGVTSLMTVAAVNIGAHMPKIQALMVELNAKIAATNDVAQQRAILKDCDTKITHLLKGMFEQEMGLKNLPPITPEMMEHISPLITYLSNIADVNDEKRSVISFFILLNTLGKWDAFKKGENVDVSNYFSTESLKRINDYLKKREASDLFTKMDPAFAKKLAESTEAVMVGERGDIAGTLGGLDRNRADLEDPDNFNEMEGRLLKLVEKFGSKQVGKALSMRFQNAEYSDEVIEALGPIENEKTALPTMQKIARIMGSFINFKKSLKSADFSAEIHKLEESLKPSAQVIAIFKKLDIEMKTDSGAKPISDDLEYLESALNKKRPELSEEEFATAKEYLDNVKKITMELYGIKDTLAKEFAALHESSKKTSEISDRFKSRLDAFLKLFMIDAADKAITLRSTMTGNLSDVIAHIRQCLACKTKEVNNDTNLTFGDKNRFLIITRDFKSDASQSLSDELVTVLETKETNEDKKFSFVMDNVYGVRSPDILVTNVLTVLKKLKAVKKAAGEQPMDIFVTNAALSSCGLTMAHLQDKIQQEFGKVAMNQTTKSVTVGQSASGDGHYEIGGGFSGRVSSRTGDVDGIVITL